VTAAFIKRVAIGATPILRRKKLGWTKASGYYRSKWKIAMENYSIALEISK